MLGFNIVSRHYEALQNQPNLDCVTCSMIRSKPTTLKTAIMAYINIGKKIRKSVSLKKFEFAFSFYPTTLVVHPFSSWELNLP